MERARPPIHSSGERATRWRELQREGSPSSWGSLAQWACTKLCIIEMSKTQGREEAKQFFCDWHRNNELCARYNNEQEKKSTGWRLAQLIIRIENEVNSQSMEQGRLQCLIHLLFLIQSHLETKMLSFQSNISTSRSRRLI